jgi:hypothetical protein
MSSLSLLSFGTLLLGFYWLGWLVLVMPSSYVRLSGIERRFKRVDGV